MNIYTIWKHKKKQIYQEKEKLAKVKIPNAQLSLAIGKGGQNVRLAARLTGWKIDIEGLEDLREQKEQERLKLEAEKEVVPDAEEKAVEEAAPQPEAGQPLVDAAETAEADIEETDEADQAKSEEEKQEIKE